MLAKDLYICTHLRVLTHREVLNMKRFTVSIPKELKYKLDKSPDVNWPMVIKDAIKEKLEKLQKFEELERKGEL